MKIGLIDSGINLNNPLIDKSHIIEGWKSDYSDYNDTLGHGTQCAYLIQKGAPEAEIYVLKVFDKNLITSSKNIINAIDWCIENNIKLINLSLSVNDVNYYYEFKRICNDANNKGIIIIASADNIGRPCLPAYLDNVFGVGVASLESETDFYYVNEAIQLYLNGDVQELKNNLFSKHATSFATARMTGIIASILSEKPDINFYELNELLKSKSVGYKEENILVKNEAFDFIKNTIPLVLSKTSETTIENLGKVLFLGANHEINLFKNYSELLIFCIQEFCELEFDSSFNLSNLSSINIINKLKIPESFNTSLEKCDTLITGKLQDDLYSFIISQSFQWKKNILSLYTIPENVAKSNNASPYIQYFLNGSDLIIKELNNIPSSHIQNNQIPILGIIDLSNKQSAFNVELMIRQKLLKDNFKFGQISANPMAPIFGFDYSFSNYRQIPIELHSAYAKAIIESVNITRAGTDLIIVGLEHPVVPVNYISSDFFYNYTLSSISLLFGFQPDVVVLVIDVFTEAEYIIKNIDCLKNLFNYDVILIINNSLNEQINSDAVNKFVPNLDQMKSIINDRAMKITDEVEKNTKISVLDINDDEQCKHIVEKIKRNFQ